MTRAAVMLSVIVMTGNVPSPGKRLEHKGPKQEPEDPKGLDAKRMTDWSHEAGHLTGNSPNLSSPSVSGGQKISANANHRNAATRRSCRRRRPPIFGLSPAPVSPAPCPNRGARHRRTGLFGYCRRCRWNGYRQGFPPPRVAIDNSWISPVTIGELSLLRSNTMIPPSPALRNFGV